MRVDADVLRQKMCGRKMLGLCAVFWSTKSIGRGRGRSGKDKEERDPLGDEGGVPSAEV